MLCALSITYPQFYQDFAEADFNDKLDALCDFYGNERFVDGVPVPALIDADKLRAQAPYFMKYAAEVSQQVNSQPRKSDVARITTLWRELTASSAFVIRISEFAKLGNISVVLVGGSIEDERVFSAMNFIKDKVRNRLDDHLELCVRLFSQNMFTLHTFPFVQAIAKWRQVAKSRGRYAPKP